MPQVGSNADMTSRVLVIAEQLHAPTPGGIGVYTAEVASRLAAIAPSLGASVELYASRVPGEDRLDAFGLPVGHSRLPHRALMRAWEWGLARKPGGYDACLSLSMAGPRFPTAPTCTFTVYDLAFREVPETFTRRGLKWHEQRLELIRAAGGRVITISEDSKAALMRAGIAESRVVLAPPGADHLPTADLEAADRLLEGLGIRSPFLLSVGTLEPRKNMARLVQAAARCRSELGGEYPLVVVGPRGWREGPQQTSGVFAVGHVEPRVLAGLYRRAAALVYVPLHEGFGLPPIEAMASCTPVVASRVPSTSPEVAEIVDPRSVDDIARGIARVLSDDRLKSSLVREGLAKASALRWEDTARKVLEAVL